jgi:hypothetical protein
MEIGSCNWCVGNELNLQRSFVEIFTAWNSEEGAMVVQQDQLHSHVTLP